LFFLGAGEGIVGTPLTRQEIGLENFDERSYLGLEPTSQMYRQYLEGVMLVPGKLDENFPMDTEISMVLNPENVGLYCDEESILYIELIQRSFMFTAETGLVVNGQQQTNHPGRSFMLLFLEAFDHLPASVFGELMERITAENSTVDSSFNVHECDMTRYPNIVFRLGDLNNNYRGSIEYAPDDYLKPISGSNRCELKIRPTRNTPYFGANFLSMIAVHLKSDRVGFCDP
jgi:hypothetical protein